MMSGLAWERQNFRSVPSFPRPLQRGEGGQIAVSILARLCPLTCPPRTCRAGCDTLSERDGRGETMALWTGFAGIALGLAVIGHLWWSKSALRSDAMECP